VIVGHSMGGVNAQQFAFDYPQLTRALVIVDSDMSFKDNPGMTEFLQGVLQMKGSISREFMTEFQMSTLSKPIDSNYFNLLVDEGLKCPLPVFQSAFKSLLETDLSGAMKKATLPVAIFWGEKDVICLPKGQLRMLSYIPHATIHVYEGTGHALHWEHPGRFAKDLVAFIQKHSENIKNK
jgi:non-heme chloroperoxidase